MTTPTSALSPATTAEVGSPLSAAVRADQMRSTEDEKQFATLWKTVERMEERMGNIERILDSETSREEDRK